MLEIQFNVSRRYLLLVNVPVKGKIKFYNAITHERKTTIVFVFFVFFFKLANRTPTWSKTYEKIESSFGDKASIS